MAFSKTASKETVFGDVRVWAGVVSADAVSGTVSFGMGTVLSAQFCGKSMTTVSATMKINAGASDAAAAGSVNFVGTTNGDEINLIVFGV